MSTISNKEALKDKIHEIHNYLRNNGAGYGMNALKVFNILYGLKKIEENNLLDKVNLKRPDCEFSYLLKIANDNKDEELSDLIRNNVLDSINDSSVKSLLLYEIPRTMKASTFAYLIKEIDKITIIEKTCNVLLSGKIYEYFIGRDDSAISELGAYFTDRHIVDYIYNKLDPEINEDGSIHSMIDMFGGSGGFTTGYINYLNNKYTNIKWKKNINNIFHYDMNDDVIKSAGLEFFCLTGILPNMKNNLSFKNSFTDSFNNKKFNFVITNPPYGGDKTVQSDTQIKRKLIKEYIKKELLELKDDPTKTEIRMKQLKDIETQEKLDKKDSDKNKVSINTCSQRIIKYAKDNNLTGNDKESASLILIMDMLEDNGTAIGVLKEGVFFNKTYKDIRKCLIENFNVKQVISVPQDQFENTSTKTSIIIFDNTKEKTSNVKFLDLVVEKYKENKFEEINDEIILIEHKDDIYNVSDVIVSEATKNEILNNSTCSLNGKDYNKKTIKCGKDYELKKIGDICDFLPKSKRNASFGNLEGKYNFYTSSDKVQKCDIADYNEECLIIGSGGIANIKIDNIFSCSADNFILKSNNNKYIYYLIKSNMKLLIDGFSGSTLKHISKEYLLNLQIPIPQTEKKIKYWVDKISEPFDNKNKYEIKLKELESEIKNKIINITENEDCDEVELGSICNFLPTTKHYTNIGKEHGPYRLYCSSQDKQLYVDMCEIKEYSIILGQGGNFNIHFDINFTASKHVCVIQSKNKNIKLLKYMYYLIPELQSNFITNGSTISWLNKTNINNFKIKIPKDKKLIEDLEPLFNKIDNLQNKIKENDILYKQYIQELSDESTT
jgi:type I restriction-modification system DNA methylase subunit